jgi:hypothetical protein
LESFPIVCAGTCRGTIQPEVVGLLFRPLAKEVGMYVLDHDPTQKFPYALVDEGGRVVGRLRTERDAREVIAALDLLRQALDCFPGLADGETPVSGPDLIDLFSEMLQRPGGRSREQP